MNIIISPYSAKLPNGRPNAKNYPYWKEIISEIKIPIIQIGVEGEEQLTPDFRKNLPLKEVEKLVKECYFWISVDNFLQHLVNHIEGPSGVVLWGKSDPKLFGYPENLNILKDKKYLRPDQFNVWYDEPFNPDAFEFPDRVIDLIKTRYKID